MENLRTATAECGCFSVFVTPGKRGQVKLANDLGVVYVTGTKGPLVKNSVCEKLASSIADRLWLKIISPKKKVSFEEVFRDEVLAAECELEL